MQTWKSSCAAAPCAGETCPIARHVQVVVRDLHEPRRPVSSFDANKGP